VALTYDVADADGHSSSRSGYQRRVDGNRRSANAGRGFIDENGKERLSVEGKLLENLRGIGSLGAARRPARHRQARV
jgi:hypothetical protein